jgi:hypothetical protein
MKYLSLILITVFSLVMVACDDVPNKTSDDKQHEQQEHLLQEATSETGMPAIKNFRERKLLKDILELRDQDGLSTYTYTFAENSGQLQFLCNSVGYGIPYATEYTNPQQITYRHDGAGSSTWQVLAQADPNGLFSPAAAEGTWVMCSDPTDKTKVRPVYIEPRVIVSPFKLQEKQ